MRSYLQERVHGWHLGPWGSGRDPECLYFCLLQAGHSLNAMVGDTVSCAMSSSEPSPEEGLRDT